ncbi:hypothetical protein D3C79_903800 [compost metagenome]
MGFNSSDKLGWLKRFGDIIIRTKSESAHNINILSSGSDHKDRYIQLITYFAAYLEAIQLGEHNVEHN